VGFRLRESRFDRSAHRIDALVQLVQWTREGSDYDLWLGQTPGLLWLVPTRPGVDEERSSAERTIVVPDTTNLLFGDQQWFYVHVSPRTTSLHCHGWRLWIAG